MNICLIKCPSPFLIDEKVFPPLGLMAVGTALKEMGHKVYIHDGALEQISKGYDCYGVGPTTPEYPYALEIKNLVDAPCIIGGPHATLNPVGCKRDGFDAVFIGGFSNYPIPDRSLIDIKSYRYCINGELATTIMTSFGCPYQCAFCSKTYPTVKMRKAEDVIKEIRYLHSDFGYKALMFFDDIFILNKNRTEKICQCLKELGIIWRCFVRGDLVIQHGLEFVTMMADSGCVEVGMGIESGSDRILSNIHKGESIETIKQAIKMLKAQGIRVKGFFIIGLPGESQKSIDETKVFAEEVDLDDMDFTIFQPYIGSPIWENREAYDIGWDGLKDMWYKGKPGEYHSNVYTSSLSNEQITEARNEMERTCRSNV